MPAFRLIDAELPDFGIPTTRPELDRDTYRARFAALSKARRQAGLDALVVYSDREHSANLAYLTGFDPRFEEALMVLAPYLVRKHYAAHEEMLRVLREEDERAAKY